MKKGLAITLLILVIAGVTLGVSPTARDELFWQKAALSDSARGYAQYAARRPGGRHTAEASRRFEARSWEDAQADGTVKAYRTYLIANPNGAHAETAREMMDGLTWESVAKLNGATRENAAQAYLSAFPNGLHSVEAMEVIEACHWERAASQNTRPAIDAFLQAHENGAHASQAKALLDELLWNQAAGGSMQDVEAYIAAYPDGLHIASAQARLEELAWAEAEAVGTIRACNAYVGQYPDGRFLEQANARAETLANDDAPFESAIQGGEQAIQAFLEAFPGHTKEDTAKSVLNDIHGRDIVDLIKEKRVEAETSGSSITSVYVNVRKRVPHPVSVRIPVGTFFVSKSPAAQNMVATSERSVTLQGDDWTSISVSAACANRPRDIPGDDDRFSIQALPSQKDLARLMPVLADKNSSTAVQQAAVWIVTDNADYADMGILVQRSLGQLSGGTRVIEEKDAALAMRICEEAGIDVTQKAIWRDRKTIRAALDEGDLKNWLSQ